MTLGTRTIAATGVMSRRKTKLRLLYSVVLIAFGVPARRSV